MPRGKKYLTLKQKIDPKKVYSAEEAIALVKETSPVKFDASIEAHFRLGIDPSKSDQQVRAIALLPHGTGKSKRVAAFVPPEKEAEAREAGADLVGGEELVAQIAQSGKIDFDIAAAVPEMMPKLAKIAKILGPKGLMPNPKTETVGTNIQKMVTELKGGKITFRNDDTANVHLIIGKVSFDSGKLLANLQTILEALGRAKPASSKGVFIRNAVLTSSMGPSVKFAA